MTTQNSKAHDEGVASYPANVNPYRPGTSEWVSWDAGYWDAHDASYTDESGGIEEGYGNFYDTDAVSMGMYDDDPNPYDGTYSEE